MKGVVTVAASVAPEGLIVCRVGYAGTRKFGTVGESLSPSTIELYSRQAAEQGHRLMLEILPDGKPSWPQAGGQCG